MQDRMQGASWLTKSDAEREALMSAIWGFAKAELQKVEALLNERLVQDDMPFRFDLTVKFKPANMGKLVSNALVETAQSLSQQERFVLEWLSKEDSGGAFGECNGRALDRLILLGLAQLGPEDERGQLYRRVTLTDLGHGVLAFAAPSQHVFAGDVGTAQ